MNEKLFFLISGEHTTLPIAEIKAILEAERIEYKTLTELPKLLIIDSDQKSLEKIAYRSAMYEACGLGLIECQDDFEMILKETKGVEFGKYLSQSESFAVRLLRVMGSSKHLDRRTLESSIGRMVLSQVKNSRVDLKNPDKVFLAIISSKKFILGLEIFRKTSKEFLNRAPKKRPAFHPATMPPKLARCMVNLARVEKEKLFLDPFCGVGSFLIEAGLIGCKVIGCDISSRMVRGTLQNLKFFKINPLGVMLADARKIPVKEVNSMVTDPPYGIEASTHKTTTEKLLLEFLPVAYETINRGGFLCLASPKDLKARELGKEAGFRLMETHYLYVHRSLTREISVFKKE
ncbi:MAG: THUMP domain-containing protein [Candidatus Bathyarchaeia archaeon]